MPSTSLPTLEDVAQHSGVSISTVSRVLNNHAHIADGTRRRVQQALVELGYGTSRRRPAAASRGAIALVALRKFEVDVGALVGGSSGFNDHIRAGAQPVLEAAALEPKTHHLAATPAQFVQYLDDVGPVGSLLIGSEVPADVIQALLERGHPFVIVGAQVDPGAASSVMADVLHGTAAAIRHLRAIGRDTIGVINGPEGSGTHADRLDGVRLGLSQVGLEFEPELTRSVEFTVAAGRRATDELLDARPDVTALLFADDFMALGGLKALSERGLRVPEDVAVIGFYDYPIAGFTSPALTSVSVDLTRMGRIASELLVALLQGGASTPWSVRIPTSLTVRASTSS